MSDDGGTEFGGTDSIAYTIPVEISPINDPPIFNFFDSITLPEDIETTIEITGIQPGPWEMNQHINMSLRSDNVDMLPHPLLNYDSPDTIASLTFSPNQNSILCKYPYFRLQNRF